MDEVVKDVSYRVRLASEMRKSIRPLMKSWGFDNPPKGSPDWFLSTRLNSWVRERDGYTDEIGFTWDRYGGSRYAIEIMTSQVERMLAPGQSVAHGRFHKIDVLDRRLYLLGGLIDIRFEWSSGRRFLRDQIAHAIERLHEANHYLLTGEASRHIFRRGCYGFPDDPPEPVFWWREGETGRANIELARSRAERRAKFRRSNGASARSPAP